MQAHSRETSFLALKQYIEALETLVVTKSENSMKSSPYSIESRLMSVCDCRSLEAMLLVLYNISAHCKEKEIITEMLGLMTQISRDSLTNVPRFRSGLYLIMAIYSLLFECTLSGKLIDVKTTIIKEASDQFQRVIELSIALASKSSDPAMWMEPPSTHSQSEDDLSIDMFANCYKDRFSGKALGVVFVLVLPRISLVIAEVDRQQQVASSILGQLIIPGLKETSRNQTPGILARIGLKHFCRQKFLAKYWRREFWDIIFMDQLFFRCTLSTFESFIINMKELLILDSEKMTEIITKLQSSTSSNIFLSREVESMNRTGMVKRLCVIALCVDREILISVLPSLQERIVDLFKMGATMGSAEIYLLIRILIYRLGDDVPMALWPVVATELIVLYKSIASEMTLMQLSLPVVTQACRLVEHVLIDGRPPAMLSMWLLFGDHEDGEEGAGLFSRILEKLSDTRGIEEPSDEIEQKIQRRQPLIPSGRLNNHYELKSFFAFSSQRLESVMSFTESIQLTEKDLYPDFIDE